MGCKIIYVLFLKRYIVPLKSNFSPQRRHVTAGAPFWRRMGVKLETSDAGCQSWQRRVKTGRWHLWVLLPFIPSSSRSDMTWVRVELLHDTNTGHVRSSTFADKNENTDHMTWSTASAESCLSLRIGQRRQQISEFYNVLDSWDSTCGVLGSVLGYLCQRKEATTWVNTTVI